MLTLRAVHCRPVRLLPLVLLLMALAHPPLALAACDPVGQLEFGPFDYRLAPPDKLRIVESYHFNADVEQLRKGQSTVNIGEDLEFVLRYFPNHSRALNSMIKLGKRERTDRPRGNRDSIDCWFERATNFAPEDGTVNLLFGLWLVQQGKKTAAAEQLKRARTSAAGNVNAAYNLGLAFLEIGDYESALEFAHIAYGLGHPLPGLRDRLTRANKWRPAPESPPAPREPADATPAGEGSPGGSSGGK
jgi:tetratricopeptide (TPR) repeat protein